jgi:mycofactocin precursor
MAPEHSPLTLQMTAATLARSLSAGPVSTSEVPGAGRSVALTARVVAVCALNTVVQLATDTTMEAGVKEQAVFEGALAQPTLTEGEPARELLVEEVSIDGMSGVY